MKLRMAVLGLSSLILLGAVPASAASPDFLKTLGIPQPRAMTCSVVIPVAHDDYVTTTKNTAVTVMPLANDQGTSLVLQGQPLHGTAVQNGTWVRYSPATNYVGSDGFGYWVVGCLQCYQGGCSEPESSTATVYVTVTN